MTAPKRDRQALNGAVSFYAEQGVLGVVLTSEEEKHGDVSFDILSAAAGLQALRFDVPVAYSSCTL